MSGKKTLLEDHHVLSRDAFKNNALLKELAKSGKLHLDDALNHIALPTDKALAQQFGQSPHPGGPLTSYEGSATIGEFSGIRGLLKKIERTADFVLVMNPSTIKAARDAALDRLAAKVRTIQSTVRYGLNQGLVFTNNPLTGNAGRPTLTF